MKTSSCNPRPWGTALAILLLAGCSALAQDAASASSIISREGTVETAKPGAETWQAAQPEQRLEPGDRVRTGPGSRAAVRLFNQSVLRLAELTTVTIQAPPGKKSPLLDLKSGSVFMFDRGRPSDMEFRAKMASGAVRGTEFLLALTPDDKVAVAIYDGAVEVSNAQGAVTLGSGEQSLVQEGVKPEKTAVINALGQIQWCLYYPAVLDPRELGLAEVPELAGSLAAYRSGELLAALAQYPANRPPATDREKAYYAGLLLAVGQVAKAEAALAALPEAGDAAPLARALRTIITAVKFQVRERSPAPAAPATASEWLAESYYRQSRSELASALDAAQQAARLAPDSGFAQERVAELEFSFGRIAAARAALDQALAKSPRNAQAHALSGFLLAARDRYEEALAAFSQAIVLDSALGNAWLGRGLCHIRLGRAVQGRDDLQAAAALEPQRSILRSYLGKTFAHLGNSSQAAHELSLARKLDPGDPTPLLYRALLDRQDNRINAAVRGIEESIALNDNRSVYRSRLLLDQDRAVRSANLAGIYQDAGMDEVALREGFKAVHSDYANYSAHLFLANSYDTLRDARAANLRYETPWLSEYLLANLLSPANAGALSQAISQNEYARMFDRNRVGLATGTDYYSNGDWVSRAAQFGVQGGTAWDLESYYRSENGWDRANNDLENLTLSLKLKQQVTPQDTLYFQAVYFTGEAGDVSQRYQPTSVLQGFRMHDYQEPLIMAGYHHEWNPGSHTLFLASRLSDRVILDNPAQGVLVFDASKPAIAASSLSVNQHYESLATIYLAEVQHILQGERHQTIFGARAQTGGFEVESRQTQPSKFGPFFPPAGPSNQRSDLDMDRVGLYGYHFWEIARPLTLVGGLAFDHLLYPDNYRMSPISLRETKADYFSPKAGFIYTPWDRTTLRGGYARYLSGIGAEQSFVLEPTQVGGFNQSLRSILPESVFGPAPGARAEVLGLALEQKLPTRTYLGASAELLRSSADREQGVFRFTGLPPFQVSSTPETMIFRERTLKLYASQLLGEEWALGASYRLSDADYQSHLWELPDGSAFSGSHLRGLLQQVNLNVRFNHRCGFFSRFESIWTAQNNSGYAPDRPGDDFWQFNVFGGYRFRKGRADVQLGVLNLADADYQLNPLNVYLDLPRERTFVATLNFRF